MGGVAAVALLVVAVATVVVLRRSGEHATAGSTPGQWTRAEAEAFDLFAVYWLGDEFEGLGLNTITREIVDDNPSSPIPIGRDGFGITYGTCTPVHGNEGCARPLTLVVGQRCDAPPELFPNYLKTEPVELGPGGSEVRFIAGATWVWTGDLVISIHGGGKEQQQRVLAAVKPMNAQALTQRGVAGFDAGAIGEGMAPPDRSQCDKIRGRDRDDVQLPSR